MTNETMSDQNKISIQTLLDALLDESTVLNPQYLYRLSDLEGAQLVAVQEAWPQIALRRRQALMEDIEALNEVDYLLSYEAISRLAPNTKALRSAFPPFASCGNMNPKT